MAKNYHIFRTPTIVFAVCEVFILAAPLKRRVKKSNHDFYWGGGQQGSLITFILFMYFFVPNVLKSFLDNKVFSFFIGEGGQKSAKKLVELTKQELLM